MRAYHQLKRGERAGAAQSFRELTRSCPQFADPWIWLSATVDDPVERITCLNKAVLLEPAHPLALDALDIAQGKVSPTAGRDEPVSVVVVRCPQCGGRLGHAPGAETVQCRHCGHRIRLQGADPPGWRAPSITTLRLMRRYRGRAWDEVEHILHCQTCGAELTRSRHLTQRCTYCGSTHVLAEDDPRILQQPDSLFPFEIDEKGAADAVRGAGRADLEIEALQGLYVPFWLFDGVVEVRWLQTYKDQAPDSVREDKLTYNNMFFPAVDVPPPSLLDEIPPFHLYRLVSYQAHFLADWPAQLPSLDVEVVAEDACDAMLALAHRRSGLPVKAQVSWDRDEDKPTPSQVSRSFQVSGVTYQLVLVPVWGALLRLGEKRRLALVNGQTGRVVLGPQIVPKSGG
jgi:DNA-directed RNA polymerase subunit RPC12/RpoP